MSTFRTLLLGATVLGLSSGTQAQSTAQSNNSEVQEITVSVRRPMAESVAAALEIQRNSSSLVSVLSADAIGNLPDQNIAFAVGRLPGVGIERDQGQARYVNLRGAPNYWTTLSFDGMSIVSPDRATAQRTDAGRPSADSIGEHPSTIGQANGRPQLRGKSFLGQTNEQGLDRGPRRVGSALAPCVNIHSRVHAKPKNQRVFSD